jgi:hypothetical protein
MQRLTLGQDDNEVKESLEIRSVSRELTFDKISPDIRTKQPFPQRYEPDTTIPMLFDSFNIISDYCTFA